MIILISGGSGLIGRAISESLVSAGHEVRWLSRHSGTYGKIRAYSWDPDRNTIDSAAFKDVETVLHLAGAGIAEHRWTESYKREIIDSRVGSASLISSEISKPHCTVRTFIGASAVGYYGMGITADCHTEGSAAGNDFLAEVCKRWEAAYEPISEAGIRTVVFRNAVVLSARGGAYRKMSRPFRYGFGAAIGSGRQFFPWIHIKDVVSAYTHAIFSNTMHGAFNVAATEQITNAGFSRALAKSFNKPLLLPNIPAAVLKLALGEMAETLLKGGCVSSDKLRKEGVAFKFNKCAEALADLAGAKASR